MAVFKQRATGGGGGGGEDAGDVSRAVFLRASLPERPENVMVSDLIRQPLGPSGPHPATGAGRAM